MAGIVAFLLAVVLASGSRLNASTFDVAYVVMIENGTHQGSGFHLGGGKILTAAHVVEDAYTLPVRIEAKGTRAKSTASRCFRLVYFGVKIGLFHLTATIKAAKQSH